MEHLSLTPEQVNGLIDDAQQTLGNARNMANDIHQAQYELLRQGWHGGAADRYRADSDGLNEELLSIMKDYDHAMQQGRDAAHILANHAQG